MVSFDSGDITSLFGLMVTTTPTVAQEALGLNGSEQLSLSFQGQKTPQSHGRTHQPMWKKHYVT